MLLETQGTVEEALIMFRQCLESRTKSLGKEHFETLASRAAVAGCLLKMNQTEQGCEEYQKVVTGYINSSGPSSPLTIKAMADLGYCLMAAGKMNDALEMYKKVTALRLAKYGSSHPMVLKSFFDTGILLVQLGQENEAIKMLKAAESGYSQVQGMEEHVAKCQGLIEYIKEQSTGEGEEEVKDANE